jgi:hypothetical protein
MAEGNLAVFPQQRLASVDDGMKFASSKHKEAAWQETLAYAGLAVSAVSHRDGGRPGVIIYVSKASARALKALPKEIDGVPVTIRKIGLISISPDKASKVTGEQRVYKRGDRIACGSSCAAGGGGDSGTFGAIVTKGGDDTLFLLSNNHVIAGCNQIPPGMPIMSPAPADARPDGYAPLSIAVLTEAIAMHSGNPKHVPPCEEDVALGRITLPDSVSSWQGGEDGYDTPTEIVDPEPDMKVKKVGRTTGLTTAVVDGEVSDPYGVNCNIQDFRAKVWFKNFWCLIGTEIPFALPGDSGSLVVTEDGKAAVGLIFSSSPNGAIGHMIPFSHIAKRLGIKLRNGHGV